MASEKTSKIARVVVDGVTGGAEVQARRSSLKLMVSNQRSRRCPLQASSRDDHGPLCRNRRVIGILERVRCGRERQDRWRGQGCERACGADRLVWFAWVWAGADRAGGWPAVAMALCGDEEAGL